MASLLTSVLLLLCFLGTCYGKGHFSALQKTLVVSASLKHGDVLKSGEDVVTVTWGFNQSLPASTAEVYKEMKVKLCYAPISQKDRGWRKTEDELSRDKTCQFTIVTRPFDFSSSKADDSIEWLIKRNTPTATYFVRVYALDSDGHEVAYGQATDDKKTTNLFDVQGISGRHASMDIASGVFSAFSLVALFGFFYAEKRKGKSSK